MRDSTRFTFGSCACHPSLDSRWDGKTPRQYIPTSYQVTNKHLPSPNFPSRPISARFTNFSKPVNALYLRRSTSLGTYYRVGVRSTLSQHVCAATGSWHRLVWLMYEVWFSPRATSPDRSHSPTFWEGHQPLANEHKVAYAGRKGVTCNQ